MIKLMVQFLTAVILLVDLELDVFAERTITGRVIHSDGTAASGARVRAWDEDLGADDFMGEAITNTAGNYSIVYAGGHWDPAPHRITTWRPDIFLTVDLQYESAWMRTYTGPTRNNHPLRENLVRNITVLPLPKVFGVVRSEENNNAVVPGAIVKLYDFDWLSPNDYMGSAQTDNDGKYEILYVRKDWDATNSSPDVQGQVFIGGMRMVTGDTVTGIMSEPLRYDLTIPARRKSKEDVKIPDTKQSAGTAGTDYMIQNRSGEIRYFYVNGELMDTLTLDSIATGHVECGAIHTLQAKDVLSDTFNGVTWTLDIRGLCFAQAVIVIDYVYY